MKTPIYEIQINAQSAWQGSEYLHPASYDAWVRRASAYSTDIGFTPDHKSRYYRRFSLATLARLRRAQDALVGVLAIDSV